jgi:hypothetical protein
MTAVTGGAALAVVEHSHQSAPRPDPTGRALQGSNCKPLIASLAFSFPDLAFNVDLYHGNDHALPAKQLVERAYARLGYASDWSSVVLHPDACPQVILQASRGTDLLGTLAVGLATSSRLQAETLYADELENFRPREILCEFTRLALDTQLAGREVLCSLFYTAYVYSHLVHAARHLFIEVNPRHARFYQRMLGFRVIGPEKLCPRVNAPAVLMHLDFDYTREQICRSRQGLSVAGTALYRLAPPLSDELLLIDRIELALA